MTMKKTFIIALILWPLIGMAGVIALKQHDTMTAATIRAPITGFDPRDMLRGHYLHFRFAPDADISLRQRGGQDYYVPEENAAQLDRLLRDPTHHFSVDVLKQGSAISFGMLYVDDMSWQDYLAKHPPSQK